MKTQFLYTCLLSSALITACGGGGGDSDNGGSSSGNFNTSAATVSSENQNELATAALVGATRSIENNETPTLPVGSSSSLAYTQSFKTTLKTEPVAVTFSEPCSVTGDFEIDFVGVSESELNNGSIPEDGTIIFDYNNCDFGDEFSDGGIDGTIVWTYTGWDFDAFDGGELDLPDMQTFEFDVSYDGEPFEGTISCIGEFDCTLSEDFDYEGIDYRVEDAQVSGSGGVYTVEARIFHEDHGYIDISATGITVDSDGNACTGTIEVSDSASSDVLSISFPDCDTMVVTFNGVATTIDQ